MDTTAPTDPTATAEATVTYFATLKRTFDKNAEKLTPEQFRERFGGLVMGFTGLAALMERTLLAAPDDLLGAACIDLCAQVVAEGRIVAKLIREMADEARETRARE